jgi:hypothetical protein
LLRLAAEAGETVPGKGKAAAPTLDRLLEWMALGSLDGDRGGGLKT